jgi:DNA-binding NarL/FixJ family response regulator
MPADIYDLLIYDAHAPSRLGLGVLLRAQPWVRRCHLAADLGTAIDLTRARRPRVAVLDVSGGGAGGEGGGVAHACEALRRVHTTVAIVLATRCPAASGGAQAASAVGAAAYLPADAGAPEIVDAVRAAAAGAPSPSAPPPASPAHRAALTAREAEVLRWLAIGATNREIADALHLSTDAIKKHSSSLYRKLGVRNRTEAAALAVG